MTAATNETTPTQATPTHTPATQGAPVRRRRGTFRSLRVRNYRLYASGQLVSLTGTWMQRVAQDWLVLQLTNSGTALGIVTALQFGPSLLLGMWGGVLADRLDKRRLLLATQSGLAIVALLLGLLDVAGVVRYWHVLVLATALGLINAIDTPVRQSFVVEMVGKDDLPNAVALNSTTFNSARILGPAIAGLMISATGTGWAFIANAASSVAVLAGLAMMRSSELYPAPQLARRRGQLREGLRYVRRRSDLLLTMILVFIVGTFGLNFQLTTALIAKQVFHRTATGYGLLSTALAVGACAGAVLSARRVRRPSSAFLVGSAVVFGMVEMLAGSMPTFELTALLLVPAGLAMLAFTNAANASVQMGVEPTMRGRVMALYLICFMGGTPLGAPIVGWVSEVFGPRWGMVGGGLISAAAALLLAVLIARRRQIGFAELTQRVGSFRSRRR